MEAERCGFLGLALSLMYELEGSDGKVKAKAKAKPIESALPRLLDDRLAAAFRNARPLEDRLNLVQCKHCRRPVEQSVAANHIRACLDKKQFKLRKKKEAKEAKDAAARRERGEKASDAGDDMDGSDKMRDGKGGADDGEGRKGKKRKANGEAEKTSKTKKKKDEPKAKSSKVKGPVDVERQCGVLLQNGQQCARSLTCKSHSMGAKRAVPGRSRPYDILLAAYQKQNQAKQQRTCSSYSAHLLSSSFHFWACYSRFSIQVQSLILTTMVCTGAAIDANAPLQDDFELANGPVDSEEERDAVMAAITRAQPQPLATKTLILPRTKYQYVRMKEMLHNALGGSRGSGLFASARIAAEKQNQQQQQQQQHQQHQQQQQQLQQQQDARFGTTFATNDNDINHEFITLSDRVGSTDFISPLNSAGLDSNVVVGGGGTGTGNSGGTGGAIGGAVGGVEAGGSGIAGSSSNATEAPSRRTSSSAARRDSNTNTNTNATTDVRQIVPTQITQPTSRKASVSGIAVPG